MRAGRQSWMKCLEHRGYRKGNRYHHPGSALAKKQEFSIDIWQVQDMYIYCDKLRVKEILVNLLGNAVKYTQTGGSISLRIIQKPCEKENFGNYEIHVKDNGCWHE